MTRANGAAWCIELEVVLLRAADGSLCYRLERGEPLDGEHPDHGALRLAGSPRAAVSHSTSWRFERPDLVVLTYAVLPDPRPELPATPLLAPAIACSPDPRLPTPEDLHAHHIAAHAVRHLAELTWTDPTVRHAATDPVQRRLWAGIHRSAAAATVGPHAEAHRAAAERAP